MIARSRSVASAFEQIADSYASAIAIQIGDRALSYAELDERANRLANRLLALGVGRGDAVGLLAERGPETIAAALGVLKTGAAYSPLDPGGPAMRLREQLED